MVEKVKTCEELARTTGISVREVRRRLVRLEKAGLVTRVGERGGWMRGPTIYPPDALPEPSAEAMVTPPPVASDNACVDYANPDPTPGIADPTAVRYQGDSYDVVMAALIDLYHSRKDGVVKAEEVAQQTGLNIRAVQRQLTARAKGGEVLKVGTRGRSAGWTLPPPPLNPDAERRRNLREEVSGLREKVSADHSERDDWGSLMSAPTPTQAGETTIRTSNCTGSRGAVEPMIAGSDGTDASDTASENN
jgi:DNA-binding IscR family transcriptional regulator